MNTPNKMTESIEEGEIIDILENLIKINSQQKSQSSEKCIDNDCLDSESELNFDKKFDDFLGNLEETTEISFILTNLASSYCNSTNRNAIEQTKKSESEADLENIEIFQILKRSPQAVKSISPKEYFKNAISPVSENNIKSGLFPIKPIAVKKISLAGRVLKSTDSTADSGASSPDFIRNFEETKPERSSNPIYKNSNFNYINSNLNDIDNRFHFFAQSQISKF